MGKLFPKSNRRTRFEKVTLAARMSNETFDLRDSRNYWRFAPSGMGKLDSSELLGLPDKEFYDLWSEHFASRFSHYWEERRIVPHFADEFSGKDVMSFGSGLGLNEIQFARAGANLTCADIVKSNLDVIKRVAHLEGLADVQTIVMEDSSRQDFGGPYDVIYANGSLMTMPAEQQKMVLSNFSKALKPDGKIILMLYTWKFVADTCGVDSPKEFALRSDPSVGDIHNPWSDWHDDDKLMSLTDGSLEITARQFWNQDYYVWFGLERKSDQERPVEEFLPLTQGAAVDHTVFSIALPDMVKQEAVVCDADNGVLTIQTSVNKYSYAATSAPFSIPQADELELLVDADLVEGAMSVALLDVAEDEMVVSRVISWEGRHLHLFPIPSDVLSRSIRFVISNFADDEPASSRFILHQVALVAPLQTRARLDRTS